MTESLRLPSPSSVPGLCRTPRAWGPPERIRRRMGEAPERPAGDREGQARFPSWEPAFPWQRSARSASARRAGAGATEPGCEARQVLCGTAGGQAAPRASLGYRAALRTGGSCGCRVRVYREEAGLRVTGAGTGDVAHAPLSSPRGRVPGFGAQVDLPCAPQTWRGPKVWRRCQASEHSRTPAAERGGPDPHSPRQSRGAGGSGPIVFGGFLPPPHPSARSWPSLDHARPLLGLGGTFSSHFSRSGFMGHPVPVLLYLKILPCF